MAEKPKKLPGPEPERIKLKGDWEKLVKKALTKPRPRRRWPTRK